MENLPAFKRATIEMVLTSTILAGPLWSVSATKCSLVMAHSPDAVALVLTEAVKELGDAVPSAWLNNHLDDLQSALHMAGAPMFVTWTMNRWAMSRALVRHLFTCVTTRRMCVEECWHETTMNHLDKILRKMVDLECPDRVLTAVQDLSAFQLELSRTRSQATSELRILTTAYSSRSPPRDEEVSICSRWFWMTQDDARAMLSDQAARTQTVARLGNKGRAVVQILEGPKLIQALKTRRVMLCTTRDDLIALLTTLADEIRSLFPAAATLCEERAPEVVDALAMSGIALCQAWAVLKPTIVRLDVMACFKEADQAAVENLLNSLLSTRNPRDGVEYTRTSGTNYQVTYQSDKLTQALRNTPRGGNSGFSRLWECAATAPVPRNPEGKEALNQEWVTTNAEEVTDKISKWLWDHNGEDNENVTCVTDGGVASSGARMYSQITHGQCVVDLLGNQGNADFQRLFKPDAPNPSFSVCTMAGETKPASRKLERCLPQLSRYLILVWKLLRLKWRHPVAVGRAIAGGQLRYFALFYDSSLSKFVMRPWSPLIKLSETPNGGLRYEAIAAAYCSSIEADLRHVGLMLLQLKAAAEPQPCPHFRDDGEGLLFYWRPTERWLPALKASMAGHGIDGFEVSKLSADAVCGQAARATATGGDALDKTPVFVKVYPRRPDRTLSLLALLSRKFPHLTPPVVDEFGTEQGHVVAWPWVDGVTLDEVVELEGLGSQLPHLLGHIRDALRELADNGIAHGDFHALNVLVTTSGAVPEAKLIDWDRAALSSRGSLQWPATDVVDATTFNKHVSLTADQRHLEAIVDRLKSFGLLPRDLDLRLDSTQALCI